MGYAVKNIDGQMMVKRQGSTAWHFIRETRRFHNEREFWIRHYMNPSDQRSIYIFKGIAMEMWGLERRTGEFGFNDDHDSTGDCDSTKVFYEGKVMLCLTSFGSPTPQLLDLRGCVLAGSNVYDYGSLCLGEDLDALTFQPADALIYNEANSDLRWRGGMLGVRNRQEGEGDEEFVITNWPTWTSSQITLPPDLLAEIEAW